MEPIHTLIRNLIDSPTQKRMIMDRLSGLYIPEEVGKIVAFENPLFLQGKYELSLYGHTEDFERFSLYKGRRKPEVMITQEFQPRERERPILACTRDGRIFFNLNLRHDGIPYKEYKRHIDSIPKDLREFKEAFDALAA